MESVTEYKISERELVKQAILYTNPTNTEVRMSISTWDSMLNYLGNNISCFNILHQGLQVYTLKCINELIAHSQLPNNPEEFFNSNSRMNILDPYRIGTLHGATSFLTLFKKYILSSPNLYKVEDLSEDKNIPITKDLYERFF